jgi:hypothetical protein
MIMIMIMIMIMMVMMTHHSFDPFKPPSRHCAHHSAHLGRARRAVVACGINLCYFHSSSAGGAEAVLPIEEKLGCWHYPMPLRHPGEHRSVPTVCMQVSVNGNLDAGWAMARCPPPLCDRSRDSANFSSTTTLYAHVEATPPPVKTHNSIFTTGT